MSQELLNAAKYSGGLVKHLPFSTKKENLQTFYFFLLAVILSTVTVPHIELK